MSSDTELRIRLYVQQLAEGKTPAPLSTQQLRPRYDTPADVPLSEAAMAALQADPLTCESLAVLADCLASLGIPQTVLAQWWHLKYKFYQDLRYGRKPIPPKAAHHLRVLFGLPAAPPDKIISPREPGKILATDRIARLLEAEPFGHKQFREVTDWLKMEFGVNHGTVAKWLGVSHSAMSLMRHGHREIKIRSALRALLTFDGIDAGKGGAQ